MKLLNTFFSLSLLTLLACSSDEVPAVEAIENPVPEVEVRTDEVETPFPLKAQLDAKKAAFELKASADKKEKYAAGIQDVRNNQIVESALQVGDVAPDFSLKNAKGEMVSLYQELTNGPVVLTWYRGGWCPYCNMTLQAMQENLPQFKALGANVLALTPELPDSSMSTAEKNALAFQVLSDVNNQVASLYKVVFKLTEAVGSLYETGFGLSQYNGNNKNELPLAATYIIGQDKIIKYAFLDADYRNRAEPSELISELTSLKGQ